MAYKKFSQSCKCKQRWRIFKKEICYFMFPNILIALIKFFVPKGEIILQGII